MCGISRSPQDTSGTSYKWYLQVVSFQQSSDVHKKCKIQASTIYPKMHTFASMRNTPFMKIDDKGGEIAQRYESFEIEQGGEIRYKSFKEIEVGHGHGQRGSNIEEKRWIKISWTREAHK